jgi:hypothetical protein
MKEIEFNYHQPGHTGYTLTHGYTLLHFADYIYFAKRDAYNIYAGLSLTPTLRKISFVKSSLRFDCGLKMYMSPEGIAFSRLFDGLTWFYASHRIYDIIARPARYMTRQILIDRFETWRDNTFIYGTSINDVLRILNSYNYYLRQNNHTTLHPGKLGLMHFKNKLKDIPNSNYIE